MDPICQTRLSPPILIPLGLTATSSQKKIKARIAMLKLYAETKRQLADCEACELLDLQHILTHGTERPRGKTTFKTPLPEVDPMALLD